MTRRKSLVALSLLVAALIGLLLSSCSKQEAPALESNQLGRNIEEKGGGETIDGEGTRSPYLLSAIVKVDELWFRTCDGNGYESEPSDRTALLLALSGDYISQFKYATRDEFKVLAEKIGDLPNEEGYMHATPVDNITTESSIVKLDIMALTPYNDSHPEGSSLMDMIRITYQSFDHLFDKTLHPTLFGSKNHAMYTAEPGMGFTPITHPALISGTPPPEFKLSHPRSDSSEPKYYGNVMGLEFTQAPSTPHQRLQVAMLFANGLKLEKEISIDIIEQRK